MKRALVAVVLVACGAEEAIEASTCLDAPCAPLPSAEGHGPVLLWSGAPADAPPCPDDAPPMYEGLGPAPEAPACPPCGCEPAPCIMPTGVSANSASCAPQQPPGTAHAEILTPDGWDGSCITSSAIPDDTMLAFVMEGPTMGPCEPVEGLAAPVPAPVVAIGCEPSAGPAGGFLECLPHAGDVACPADRSVRHVFYERIDDARGCAPCTCGPPSGAACTVWMQAYLQPECVALWFAGKMTGDTPHCAYASEPWVTVGSIQALPVEAVPGSCPPSGAQPTGEVTASEPTTFCCRAP